MTSAKSFFDWEYTRRFTAAELTSLPGKAAHYAVEATFRESLYSCARSGGTPAQLGADIRRVGLGLFRPDAIAHDRIPAILDYLARFDIRPFYCVPTAVTPPMVREIWRYQLNVASGERLRLMDLLFDASPSILTLFETHSDRLPLPCSVIMSDVKGEADPDIRQGWELRSHLASPNRIEVYLHVADEPADVVRDAGIVLGPEGCAQALARRGTEFDPTSIMELGRHIRGQMSSLTPPLDPPLPDIRALSDVRGDGGREPDRWAVIRELGSRCEMYAGPGENIIDEPGTDEWWLRAGLLDVRTRRLAERAGMAAPAEPAVHH